ncbi:MAG TPA: hypothetical protein VML55_02900, partial [Planctomycetaceae bacterium]|nr:hypothetical protein [Planctomycetaceae bacterium]
GRFAEANRHPRYIALLSLSPRFESGQVLSVVLAGSALIATSLLCARRFGLATAGCFAVLLATNAAFCRFATSVVCEVLVVLLTGLAWFAWTAPERPAASPPPEPLERATCGRWAFVGTLLALVWLTKATGLLLTVAAAAWLGWNVWHGRFNRRWLLATAAFGVAWCVVASPLLVRNFRLFGNPVYNVNSKLLFADAYSSAVLNSPESTRELARRYWRTHGVADIVEREVRGLVWETFILLRSLGPPPLDDSRVLVGGILALLACVGGTACPAAGRVTLLWTAVLVPVFAWYVPVAAGERFVMPLLVPLLALAAHGAVVVLGATADDRGRTGGWLVAGALAWCGVWTAATWLA